MSAIEFSPRQTETERLTVHLIWMTSGLGCDGDTVALTAATRPSLEALLTRAEAWRPWRAIATAHLWANAGNGVQP